MNPKVSIVLPCYNGASMLPQAIESVLSQTFQDWELIIVNDCSTDNTLEIAMRYEENDERIRVFSNSVNKKLPASLNEGFSHARGEYFTWTSDDNILLPNMLDVLCKFLDNHDDIYLVASDFITSNFDGSKQKTEVFDDDLQLYMTLNNYVGFSFMYRSSVLTEIGGYDENLFLVEDYEYWIRIWTKFKVRRINEILYIRRCHDRSLTSTRQADIAKKLLDVRLKYLNTTENKLKKHPQLLALYYYRITDQAYGLNKIKFFTLFFRRLPYWYGIRYIFIHIPHLIIKKI